jgi:hypothetical protein
MAITTLDGLVASMTAATRQRRIINQPVITGQAGGGFSSYWRAAGIPGQGAIPAAASAVNQSTLGSMKYTAATGGQSTYLARAGVSCGAPMAVEVHDRLAHMGGLSGTVTTAQTVGISLLSLASTDNIAARKGADNYSAVSWYLEWYTSTGSTAATATVTYTNHLGVTGRTTTVSLPTNVGASRMLMIAPLAGEWIRSIESVQLSATTGTAGNFGVTVSRPLTEMVFAVSNSIVVLDWAATGLPIIETNAALTFIGFLGGGASAGALYGSITLIQG